MRELRCAVCGGNELQRAGNTYVCAYCGSKFILDENDSIIERDTSEIDFLRLIDRAQTLHEEKKFPDELHILQTLHEKDPVNTDVLIKLGRCYRSLDKTDLAIKFYNRAIELNPNDGTAYTNIGTIHILREEYAEAKPLYEKGLPLIDKATFDYWVAYADYAIVVAKLGDPKKAEKIIEEAESRGYKKGDIVRQLAGIKKKKGWFW